MKILFLIIITIIAVGCQKKSTIVYSYPDLEAYAEYEDFLSTVDKITLYSTNSTPYYPEDGAAPKELFHGYEVMGSLEITDKDTIVKVLTSIKDNVYDEPGTALAMCFNPRHGMRMQSKHDIKDFLICFQCSHLYIYDDIASNKRNLIGLKTQSDNSYLNSTLDNHNIPREIVEKSD